MRLFTGLLYTTLSFLLLLSAACSGGGKTGSSPDTTMVIDALPDLGDTGGTAEVAADGLDFGGGDWASDSAFLDSGGLCDQSPAAFGCPCDNNNECMAGFCVESEYGFVCTEECMEECPKGWECKGMTGFGADLVFLCVPLPMPLCIPCETDEHCGEGTCMEIGEDAYCSVACGGNLPCPPYYSCLEGDDGGYCIPDSADCTCTGGNAGETRPCVDENESGACEGLETCDPESGWSDCDAPDPEPEVCDGADNDCNGEVDDGLPETEPCEEVTELGTCEGDAICLGEQGWVCLAEPPQPEICDYADNNCDGVIDEDFSDGDKYTTDQHCGTCNNDCSIAIENGTGVCDPQYTVPKCVVGECNPGFLQISPFQCALPPDATCLPCETDEECAGGFCLELDGQKRCIVPCGEAQECQPETACEELPELVLNQAQTKALFA